MAITFTTSGSTSNGSATSSITFTAFVSTVGQKLALGIALGDITQTVTSITDTAGNTYLFSYGLNQSTVRTELWVVNSMIANAANVITVNFSSPVLASGAFGEYAGPTGFTPPPFETGGPSATPGASVNSVGSNDWMVAFFGVATQSTDTFTPSHGNLRQSIIPALTSVSMFMMDITSPLSGTIAVYGTLSVSRQWAAVATGFTSGSPALLATATNFRDSTTADRLSQHQVMKTPVTSQSVLSSTANTGFVA